MPPLSGFRLGPVGNLIQLPLPGNDIEASVEKVGGSHRLLAGGQTFDVMGSRRSYQLHWSRLDPSEQAVLEALYMGLYGPGPFVLVDPTRVNLLSANQSTGSNARGDAAGFSTPAGGVLASSTALPRTGARSLLWTHPAGAAVSGAAVSADYGSYGVAANPALDMPTIPALSYTGSVYVRSAGATLSLNTLIWWQSAAGTYLSASAGGAVAVTSAAWFRLSVSGTAPAGAHLGKLTLFNNAVLPAAHAGFYTADWQFEQAAAASPPVVGSGVPRVHFAALTDVYPKSGQHNMEATLLAVA